MKTYAEPELVEVEDDPELQKLVALSHRLRAAGLLPGFRFPLALNRHDTPATYQILKANLEKLGERLPSTLNTADAA
jgi:hypothetical protein